MSSGPRGSEGLPSRRVLGALLLLLGLLGLLPVRTAIAQTKSMAVYVEGPNADAARQAVIDALPAGANIVNDQTFRKELTHQGQKKPFGRNVDARSIERVRRAAAAVGADEVLLVRVRKANPRAALLLQVGPSGKVSADREIRLRVGLKDEDRDELRRSLSPNEETPSPENRAAEPAPSVATPHEVETRTPPDRPNPAPPPAPPPAAPAPIPIPAILESPQAEAGARISPSRPGGARAVMTTPIVVAVDGGFEARRFDYRNGIGPYAFTLNQPAMPVVGIGAELFPLASSGLAWGDFGFVGDCSMMFSPSWAGTNPIGYDVGVRARVHPGINPPVLLNLTVGYEFRWFGAYDSGRERLPDVTYRAARPAVDVRVPIGHFSLLAGTALRAILEPHEISEQFYNPTGIGFDAHAGFAAMFLAHFEARLEASYARYSFTFKPPTGATFGTGGAIDQVYGGQLAIAYVY